MTAQLRSEGIHNLAWLNSRLGHLAGLDVPSPFHPVIKVCDQDSFVLNKSLREREVPLLGMKKKPSPANVNRHHLPPQTQVLCFPSTACSPGVRMCLIQIYAGHRQTVQFKLNPPHCHCSARVMMLLSKLHVWLKPLRVKTVHTSDICR